MASPLTVLTRNRDFRLLFGAEIVMFGGDWFVMIPLLGLLQHLTGKGLLGGLALAADTGVNALLLPFAGTVADRVDRRKIMVVANLAAVGAVGLLFALRSPGMAWLGPVAVGLIAVAKAFYTPAASAATPNVVPAEDLSAAIAIAGSAWGTMTVVGASLGGVFAQLFSPYTCFAITAAGLLAAAVLAIRLRTPLQAPREPTGRPGMLSALRESARYIRRQPRVGALVTVKSGVGIGNGVLAVYPTLAVLLHAGGLGTGLLFALRGAGALIGPLLLRTLLRRPARLLPGLALAMVTYAVCYLGIAAVHWFPVVLVLILVAHVAGGGNWATSSAGLQAELPDELRGRVLAADLMLATFAVATSQVVAGLLVDRVDPWLLIAGCACATLLYATVWRIWTVRAIRSAGTPQPSPAGVLR